MNRFEDEFPDAARFLWALYAKPPEYVDSRGRLHHLPARLHVGANGKCWTIEIYEKSPHMG
jgi:hypothetical protein